MQFQTTMISNKGGRATNQDYVAFKESFDGGCWVLADGLGGYQGGEIAAKLAVDTILKEYQQHQSLHWLKNAIDKSQEALHKQQKLSLHMKKMRTTLIALTCKNNHACWAHIGDSRLYHFREGKLLSQTKDHSVCQALVNAGEITTSQIRYHEDRNRLYRVLGTDGAVKATILTEEVSIQKEDAFLLCSDGFWEAVTEEEMENTSVIASSPHEWLQMMELILFERMKANHDNYSAIAVIVTN
ncbi:serine/threonine protein phosphatase PrpC [Cytobacillus eiseniae]|uniref:Serine/threonine protein phosphatase PrpC n=1 Tax=Cytobacillus eiseniae TaxID=762947 RepID=A0ABS4RAF6_9BACI|nr:protein phosphatase 2C domain-containing protein [Cytobacillus eiseniae]MBP2239870.1 serine/threonine protein phosphatase PrpC [Cytobacillus eiseniae]